MKVRAGAHACAPYPSNHIPLLHPFAGSDIKLRKVAVEGAPCWVAMFDLNSKAIATKPTTTHHTAGKRSNHWSACCCSVITTSVHQPTPQNRVVSPTKATAEVGLANNREKQPLVAIS